VSYKIISNGRESGSKKYSEAPSFSIFSILLDYVYKIAFIFYVYFKGSANEYFAIKL